MEKTIRYQNKKIVYRTLGNGKPVMLIHGFGEDGNVWARQAEYLKDNCYLVMPDLPGSGHSEMIEDMSMEGLAEVIHSIIHEEQIDQWTVIGHSMGGYITLALVESYWNHVNAFGLFHSTAFPDNEEKKQTRKKGIEFINRHGAFAFLKNSTPNLFSPRSKELMQDQIDNFISGLKDFRADALIAYYHSMMNRPDRTGVLKTTEKPVLFIAGEHDNAAPLNDVLEQCHLPEKSYFHLLKNSGHMGMIEEAETANRILQDFLLNHEN